MAKGDLTTLEHVKLWLDMDPKVEDSAADPLLRLMITSASRFVLGYLNRPTLAATNITEVYDGYGNNFMVIRQWPVIDIQSIDFFGLSITKESTGNPRTSGYILSPDSVMEGGQKRVSLWGYTFPRARAAISLSYRAGYLIVDERHKVPADPYKINTNYIWLEDEGVKYADTGLAFERVDGDPAVGQYSVDDYDGTYTFNEFDEDETVLISYSYVPADIEQATYQMVGEQYRYKDRVGIQSKGLSGGVGETVSFSQKDMTEYVRSLLQPYRRVVPV